MKRLNNFIRRSVSALLASLVLMTAFGAQTARAQDEGTSIQPFVDCIEREYSGGAETGYYIAYFGYSSFDTSDIVFPSGGQNNFFSPEDIGLQNRISVFAPGVHPRVVSTKVPIGQEVTWFLGVGFATVSFERSKLCAPDGANSRLVTYQGKLSDGAQAANGTYDLQFQLFNKLTGGTARTGLITLDNVPVTGGVFTVQLDLGANALVDGGAAGNLKLNPAILDAQDSFFEIKVRPGTSTGAYTTLTTRQPITAVPLAMRANTANNAFRAAYADNAKNAKNADNATNATNLGGVAANQYLTTTNANSTLIRNTTTQQTGNFNVSGNGTIGGTLTANTTNIGGILTATKTNISGTIENLLNVSGSSTYGTQLTMDNTTTGGHQWKIISTGASNGEGAGKLLFYDLTSATGRLLLSDAGANINGDLTVSGAISGATKNFKIDHPLDPANKTLTYTSVESPDMMNIYNGNITTDANGDAIVQMPAYFEALNKDFRYQLTVIGQFAQAIVLEKIKSAQFKIKTDKPNVEVSWMVTGIRHDKFAEDKQTNVEQDKAAADKGKCLYAPACGGKEQR